MRRAAKVDENQAEIVQALRMAGASVAITSMIGGGFPDLVVGWRGVTYLLEVKDGSKPPSRRKLTPQEREFYQTWRGQYDVVGSVADALEVLGIEARL